MNEPNDLGLIDAAKMHGIPQNLRMLHEATFYFQNRLVGAIRDIESAGPRTVSIDIPAEKLAAAKSFAELDGVDFLRALGEPEKANAIILGECVLALAADALLFLQEALFTYEKGKIRVSLSLLRKPMKENLLYLEWILADENDFMAAFANQNRKALSVESLTPDRRRELITGAIAKCANTSFLDPAALYDMRYNKAAAFGLEPLWQKAQHLITTHGAYLLTETENFNFIFIKPDEQERIYERVAIFYFMLTIHLYDVVTAALARSYELHRGAQQYDALCKLAAMSIARENFEDFGRVAKPLIETLNDLLSCDCGGKFEVSATAFAKSLFCDKLRCTTCGEEDEINLFENLRFSEFL